MLLLVGAMQPRFGALLVAGVAAARINVHRSGTDAKGTTLVADAADLGFLSTFELSAALRSLDQDGDGDISRAEFQAHLDINEVTAYLGVRTHSGALPTEPEARFRLLDQDENGHLDPAEQERGASLAEVAAVLSRRAARGNASSLDGALAEKVKDPRCEHAPEGYLCLTDHSMIYCSDKKRLGEQKNCMWEGYCKRGPFGVGGCSYPLCDGREDGLHCHDTGDKMVVVGCNKVHVDGGKERESSLKHICKRGCESFPDGPPPTRRRRTCNGGHKCTEGDCDTTPEISDMQWAVPGCKKSGRSSHSGGGRDELRSIKEKAGVRCCSYYDTKCDSRLADCTRQTYKDAEATCAAHGKRLCSWHELKTMLCCNSGCNFDSEHVWALRDSYDMSPNEFNPNTFHLPSASVELCYKKEDKEDKPFARCAW